MGAEIGQLQLFEGDGAPYERSCGSLQEELRDFDDFGSRTVASRVVLSDVDLPLFVNEFWTSKQRQASRLHEVSYRACFKPQLPAFFVQRLTSPGELVHDPFMGRGTTVLESLLLDRDAAGCDINPLSVVLVAPRTRPPTVDEVAERLETLELGGDLDPDPDLLTFFHPETLRELQSLRHYLLQGKRKRDPVDDWIAMVATNRLTGHSPGFFSVYTMPPNQAVSPDAQRKINVSRDQQPEYRDIKLLILRKTRSLLGGVDDETRARLQGRSVNLFSGPATAKSKLKDDSVALVVTSPPFLDVVQYAADNWLRCWFCGIDPDAVAIPTHRQLPDWQAEMTGAFRELRRVLRPGGHVAFEVGEVRRGTVKLEEAVVPCAIEAGLEPVLILINDQQFTKTANCWGVSNNAKGTNTNRIVLLRK